MALTGSRTDEYSVGLTINGDDYGVWDKFDGGEVDSNETKYRPGGLGPEIPLGGTRTVNNFTVTRLYDLDRDHTRVKHLMAIAGRAKVVCHKQPLDVDGNPYGEPLVYKGTLKMVTPPPVDSEGSEAAVVALEISSAGLVG